MENNQNMGKGNNKVVLVLTIVIVLLLVVIIALGMNIAKKEYKYCNDCEVQDKVDDYFDDFIDEEDEIEDIPDNCITLKDNEYDVYIDIFSMDEPIITEVSSNHHLYITGKMNISFREENFIVVGLEGYCLGDKNEKYMMHGPRESEISFNNGDMEYYLVESINDEYGDVIYPDGTKKNSGDVDWKNVKIKSCKIEKLYTVYNKNGKTVMSYTGLNFEKTFD